MAESNGERGPAGAQAEEKPEWAMSRRQRENARRRREGLKPLPARWPWILLALVVVGGAGGWYYQTQIVPTLPQAEIVAEAEPDPLDSRMQVNPFEYAVLQPQTLQRRIRVTGTLQPSAQSQIAAQASGRVEEVTVRPGDRVAAGQLLVQVDVEALRLQLDTQRSTAEATRAQLSLAEAQLERAEALVERGVSSTSNLDSARTNVEGLRAQVSALADQVASAELSLRQATVIAPFAGVISTRSVEPGQFVSTGTPLVTIVDLETVEFQANGPIASGAQIGAGQEVRVTVDGIRDRIFTGVVTRINPVATQGARTLPIYIDIENADGVLLGGMFSIGEVVVAEAEDAIGVPAEALREDRDGVHVLKIVDGALVAQPVTAGETWAGNLVQITAGLSAGDTVITAALPELNAGDDVVLVEQDG